MGPPVGGLPVNGLPVGRQPDMAEDGLIFGTKFEAILNLFRDSRRCLRRSVDFQETQ